MKTLIMTIAFILTLSSASAIEAFESDGCSAMAPDGTFNEPNKWSHCCYVHDMQYWAGGTKAQRKTADNEFRACLADNTSMTRAQIYRFGVRIGGIPYTFFPWRWSFGYSGIRAYAPLNEQELREITEKMHSILTELNEWAPKLRSDQIEYIEKSYEDFEDRMYEGLYSL